MRNEQGQFIKGTTGNSLGRPKRADEQVLIDIWDQSGRKQFINAVNKGERWALKLLVDKLYANKKETGEVAGHEIKVSVINFDPSFEPEHELRRPVLRSSSLLIK